MPKPFDLQAALNGAPVVTRGGNKVVQLHHFKVNASNKQSVYGIVVGDDDEYIQCWDERGNFWNTEQKASPYDLIMAPVMREGWANIYNETRAGACIGDVYPTRGAAESALRRDDERVAIVRIEWEE